LSSQEIPPRLDFIIDQLPTFIEKVEVCSGSEGDVPDSERITETIRLAVENTRCENVKGEAARDRV
jgi:hypothetical protein